MDDATQKLVDGLRAEIEDIRGGYTASTAALDRFRDVVCEVTGYGDENPGDDVVIAKLREMHDKIGPEPTQWRDFMVGANAARDQILAHHAAAALESAQRPPVSPEVPDDALIEAMARALNPFAWKVRDKYMSHPHHEALELDVMVEDSIRQARAAYAALRGAMQ